MLTVFHAFFHENREELWLLIGKVNLARKVLISVVCQVEGWVRMTTLWHNIEVGVKVNIQLLKIWSQLELSSVLDGKPKPSIQKLCCVYGQQKGEGKVMHAWEVLTMSYDR